LIPCCFNSSAIGNYNVANDLKQSGHNIISKESGASFLVPDRLYTDSPWSNPKVSTAAEYAIDKEAMTKAFGCGFTRAACQLALPGSPRSLFQALPAGSMM